MRRAAIDLPAIAANSPLAATAAQNGTARRIDGRTPYRYIDFAAYYASSVNTRVSVMVSVNLGARIRLLRTSKELG